ncbi:MAG TPA: porin [Gemmatimonadaceae bacterium]|nr:porin [Gemmatimonadaceae bacterium]
MPVVRRLPACAFALLVVAAPSVGAQAPRAPTDERGALRLATEGETQLTLGGYLQVDGRWVSGALQSQPDGLLLRRARLIFDAAMPSGWHVRLQPDFGQGRVLVQDAFVGYEQGRVRARLGRFRPAFGVERFQSSATLLHGERSLVNSLMPSRSFGGQVELRRDALTLAVGAFRTPIGTDLQVVDTDGDVDAVDGSGHDWLLRAAWSRRRGARYADVQVALLEGRERGEPGATGVSRLLTVGQQPLLAFRNDGTDAGTVLADGARRRLSAGAVLGDVRTMLAFEGALFAQGARLPGRRQVGGGAPELRRTVSAGVLSWRAAHLIGGERRPTQEVLPRHARGALDLGVRAATLSVWGDDIGAVITRRSITHAASGGVAIGWIPTSLTRLSLAYDVTVVRPGREVREHALLMRVQQGF